MFLILFNVSFFLHIKMYLFISFSVTQLIGNEPIQFGRSSYRIEVSEAAKPGPLLQLTARVLTQGNQINF